jgi:2-oxoisovalerate dehydrogenase E1 component alpha subunit
VILAGTDMPVRKQARSRLTALAQGEIATNALPAERCLQIYRLMVRARALEEQLIKMSKSGQGYLWIGGPGEEAFNICLGLQIKKGCGPAYDYLHLHYRGSAILVAMGMPLLEAVRQMAMRATDRHSLGRNFVGHFSRRDWNVIPVTSVVANQYAMAPGTARVQKQHGGDGITIVTGGDAGTVEADFATCMIWSTRPGEALPVLMIVTNNGWGISTATCTQNVAPSAIERGKAFGIPGEVLDGNDVIASWFAIRRAMDYCRHERRPYLLEARVSRLYGHSSASGAARAKVEPDCIALFEKELNQRKILNDETRASVSDAAHAEAEAAILQAMRESAPSPDMLYKHTYAPSPIDAVYSKDYSGLPRCDGNAHGTLTNRTTYSTYTKQHHPE